MGTSRPGKNTLPLVPLSVEMPPMSCINLGGSLMQNLPETVPQSNAASSLPPLPTSGTLNSYSSLPILAVINSLSLAWRASYVSLSVKENSNVVSYLSGEMHVLPRFVGEFGEIEADGVADQCFERAWHCHFFNIVCQGRA